MSADSIFLHSSYKSVMKSRLRGTTSRGTLSRAAEALRCQRSFLSQVMNAKVNLTPDLAFKLSLFFKFTAKEREYFQMLVEEERATDPQYREFLQTRLRELRREHESLTERSQRPAATHDQLYFSAWFWTAIHFLTSLPNYQTQDSIAQKIGVPGKIVGTCLEQLLAWGFVQKIGEKWIYSGGEFHLPKHSPLVVWHHQNWRQRAILDSQMANDKSLHFTNVHTIASKDIPVIKELLLKFISDSNEVLRKSNTEEVVVLLCDFFTLT